VPNHQAPSPLDSNAASARRTSSKAAHYRPHRSKVRSRRSHMPRGRSRLRSLDIQLSKSFLPSLQRRVSAIPKATAPAKMTVTLTSRPTCRRSPHAAATAARPARCRRRLLVVPVNATASRALVPASSSTAKANAAATLTAPNVVASRRTNIVVVLLGGKASSCASEALSATNSVFFSGLKLSFT